MSETIQLPPVPTGVVHGWWPVTVEFPDATRQRRTRVYATPEGLYVYASRVPADGFTPAWYSPIKWDETPRFGNTPATRMNGHRVETTAGLVVIHGGDGCNCSHPLKRWTPTYAANALPWPGDA